MTQLANDISGRPFFGDRLPMRPAFVSVLLMGSAILKVDYLWHTPVARGHPLDQIMTQFGLVLELVIASMVCLGTTRRLGMLLSMIAWTGFAVYQIIQIAEAAPPCNCFGRIKLSHEILLALDIVMAIMTGTWLRQDRGKYRFPSVLALMCLFALPALAMATLTAKDLFRPASVEHTDIPASATPSRYDLGELSPTNAVGDRVFTINNSSDQPIQILDVQSSCGCTVVDRTIEQIPARGSIQVPVRFNWHLKTGGVQETVELTLQHAGMKGRLSLTLSGLVTTSYRISSETLDFAHTKVGKTDERILRIAKDAGSARLSVDAIMFDNNEFSIDADATGLVMPAELKDGVPQSIKVLYRPSGSTPMSKGKMTIKLSDPSRPEAVVYLAGFCADREVKR